MSPKGLFQFHQEETQTQANKHTDSPGPRGDTTRGVSPKNFMMFISTPGRYANSVACLDQLDSKHPTLSSIILGGFLGRFKPHNLHFLPIYKITHT